MTAGGIVSLVPKLYLGTHLSAQLCCFSAAVFRRGSAMELPQQLRSQMEFGNEVKSHYGGSASGPTLTSVPSFSFLFRNGRDDPLSLLGSFEMALDDGSYLSIKMARDILLWIEALGLNDGFREGFDMRRRIFDKVGYLSGR